MNEVAPTTITAEVYALIRSYVGWETRSKPDLLRFQSIDDLTQDVAEKFLKHNHVAKYNPEITSFKWHILRGVKTTLIDRLRKEKYRRKEWEFDRPVGSEDGDSTFGDFIEQRETLPQDVLFLIETLSELRRRAKEWGEEKDVPFLGRTRVSAYVVYVLDLLGFQKKEIGEILGFSGARAGQIVNDAERMLAEAGIKTPVLVL